MKPEELTQKLDDMLTNGPMMNIFDFERARKLFLTISDYATPINEASYGAFFGTVQQHAQREMYISISKMFDPYSKEYDTRSFPSILTLMRKNAGNLPVSIAHLIHIRELNGEKEQTVVTKTETSIKMETKWLGLPSKPQINPKVVTQLIREVRAGMPEACKAGKGHELSDHLLKVKEMRDKVVVHNEQAIKVQGASLKEMDQLVDWAKASYEALAKCIIHNHTVYVGERYPHTDAAERPSRCMERMLFDSGVIKNPGHLFERTPPAPQKTTPFQSLLLTILKKTGYTIPES